MAQFHWPSFMVVDTDEAAEVLNPMDVVAGGGNSNISLCSPLPGEMIQFDDHIFQMG